MRRALHPDLTKRAIYRDRRGGTRLEQTTFTGMLQETGSGGGAASAFRGRPFEVHVCDLSDEIASVRVRSAEYVDYLHLVRWNGEWRIINVLWDLTKEAKSAPR